MPLGPLQALRREGGRRLSRTAVKASPKSGGRISRFKVAGLCGLADSGWTLEHVRTDGAGGLRLFVVSGEEKATVLIKPAPSRNYFLRSGAFDLCYEGKKASPRLTAFLEGLAPALKDKRPADLLAAVENDPEASPETPEASSFNDMAPDAQGVTDRLGGNPGQWRRFFCHREFERKFHWAHPTGFSGRILYFVHGDFDCTFMPPDVMYRGMNFINYPPIHPHSSDSPVPDTAFEQWASDLRSRDIIMGTRPKVDAFVDSLKKRARPDDLVMISWSCVPTIIGDDEGAMEKACREAGTCPVLINSIRYRMQDGSFSLFEDLFNDVKSRPAFKETPRDPDAVNVLDCQPAYVREELEGFLAEAGIRINSRIFPVIDVPALNRYLSAASQIIPVYLRKKESVIRALSGLPLETVYAPPPYGIEGARSYAMAVARSVGKEQAAFEVWEKYWEKHRARWEALSKEAQEHRLAFVADESTLEILLRDGFVAGIPVLKAVGEMGFGIDFLIYAPGGRLPAAAEELKRLMWFKKAPEVHAYTDPKDLARILEEGPFAAVYSDIFFDYRLTCAGKAQFSMRTFEAGVLGALRSLERLLDICRLPFYKKYSKYLKRVSRGQDV